MTEQSLSPAHGSRDLRDVAAQYWERSLLMNPRTLAKWLTERVGRVVVADEAKRVQITLKEQLEVLMSGRMPTAGARLPACEQTWANGVGASTEKRNPKRKEVMAA